LRKQSRVTLLPDRLSRGTARIRLACACRTDRCPADGNEGADR